MKKQFMVFIALLIMIMPLMGCLQDEVTASSLVPRLKGVEDNQVKQESRISSLETNRVSKADLDASLTNSKAYTDQKIASSPSTNSYTKSETYTKAEVDLLITQKINEYKASLVNSNSASPTGNVTFITSPVSIPQLFTSSTGMMQQMYTMKIQNGTSQWQYVKPIITFSIASGQSPTTVTELNISMSAGSYNLTTTSSNFNIAPAISTPSIPSFIVTPINGANGTGEVQIGAGQSIDILIVIQNMKTSTNCLWNVSNSISSRGL